MVLEKLAKFFREGVLIGMPSIPCYVYYAVRSLLYVSRLHRDEA